MPSPHTTARLCKTPLCATNPALRPQPRGERIAEKHPIEAIVGCGGLAGSLRAMLERVVVAPAGVPVTTAIDFIIQACERLVEVHEPGMARDTQPGGDPRMVIASLGALLHELLGGERVIRSDLPPGLQSIVRGCLDNARADRIPDARGLAIALAPYASRSGQLHARRLQHPF
jgi:hypothetical protein